ncbi:uncharacterized protein BDR25DRAFT_343778 [Lindgomyces ingoldianus]|uniref:Uncharacterized protein n=1 Tax=Lindgomyces ingoldianus TaxID=673940 RepID=A0ACB6QR74_9PLEO|nr:uncharacterized protein BDR25DRAFT_343778 [Lindgomyces ingoldianus]KAF2469426.1 hypothetical protein BDR25DRAFT_343778 [Lindgomyces ingoldianus]
MPHASISVLGINYRCNPLLRIDGDIYSDTRSILQKLEERFPEGRLGMRGGMRMEKYWGRQALYCGPGILKAGGLIPKDRKAYRGEPWTKEALSEGSPENLGYIRGSLEVLGRTLLPDVRNWVLKTENRHLVEIKVCDTQSRSRLASPPPPAQRPALQLLLFVHALEFLITVSGSLKMQISIWPFDWLAKQKGSMPPSVVSERRFPKVRRKRSLGVKEGVEVEVYPTDSGFIYRDRGWLMTLTPNEATVAAKSGVGDTDIRIHAPRSGFRITLVGISSKR